MGRAPCCDKSKVKRGPWSPEEDATLKNFIQQYGTGGNWISLPSKAGLKRCGKSCRLRWLNYLRPDIKHGGFTQEEDHFICTLYANIGSRWSIIASQLPGRTDNDVKNYWNTKLKKKYLASKINNSASNENSTQILANSNSIYEPLNLSFNTESGGDPNSMPSVTEMGNYFCNYSQQDLILDQTQFLSPTEASSFRYGFPDGNVGSSSVTVALEEHCGAAVWTAADGSSTVEEDGISNGYFGFDSLNCELFNDLGFDQEIHMAN